MNTEKSDRIVKAWRQQPNKLPRAQFVNQRTFNTSPEALFRLLCPTTEYDWLPGFECRLLHSESGYAEYNAVFETNVFGPEETWICTRFETGKAIDYASVSEHSCGKLDISVVDNGDGTVTGMWIVTRSALTEEGNMTKAEIEQARAHFVKILDWLEHYINTGEMVSEAAVH